MHVAEHLGVSWAKNHLLKAQAQQLLSQQLALLPHDAEEAAYRKKLDDFRKKRSELRKQKKELNNMKCRFLDGTYTEDDCAKLGVTPAKGFLMIQKAINELHSAINEAEYSVIVEQTEYERLHRDTCGTKRAREASSKVNCPVADCRGFANDAWKCTACETRICHECHEVSQEGHVCDPNILENIKLLRQDTKPCPTCETPIHKINGCDQMWCVKCHTAFSWNTGRIERGMVHNPHFYAWQNDVARGVRNVGDVACGGVPSRREFYNKMLSLMSLLSVSLFDDEGKPTTDETLIHEVTKTQLQLEKICQIVCAFTLYADQLSDSINDIRFELNRREEKLQDMRIAYINGAIKDDAAYTRKLVKHLTEVQQNVELSMVLEMVSACVIERLRSICETELIDDVGLFWSELTTSIHECSWMHTCGDAQLRKAFSLASALRISRNPQCTIYDFMTVNLKPMFVESKHKAAPITRKALDEFARIADEMVQVVNYGNEQVDNIGKAFNFTPGSYKVPENAADISVPDEMVKKVTEEDSCIMPNFRNHAFLSTEWHLIRSDLVQSFGLHI